MKFGVCLPNFPFGVEPSRTAIVGVAKEAALLGYDSLWVSDHILVPAEYPRYGRLFESLSTLAYIGGVTEQIRLGTSILVVPYRSAIVIAKQAATIDALTDGRLILGVGAGWIEGEFAALDVDFENRGRRLDESLAVMRTLWTDDDPTVDGEVYQFSDVLFEPKPAQTGGVPIWVGGHSTAALRRAVTYGAAWHPDDLGPDELADYTRRLDEMSDGRTIDISLRRTVDARPAMTIAESGAGGETEGQWEGGTASALTGSVDEILGEIEQVAALGVTHLICQFEHRTQREHLDQMRFFVEEIIQTLNGER